MDWLLVTHPIAANRAAEFGDVKALYQISALDLEL
jgi:hypothetical protein